MRSEEIVDLKGKTINFLGDSITEGIGVKDPQNVYHQIIKEKFGLKSANNYGISGTRIAKQRIPTVESLSFDQWFASRIDNMTDKADAIIVFGGTNDWGHGDALIGTFSDRTDETFYGACHNLFEKLICKYPGKPIVIVTPLHRIGEYDLHIRGEMKLSLKNYVDIIKEVAIHYSLPVCDLYAISGIQPDVEIIRKKFIPDGLHPNDAGHAILAERIGSFLRNL